MDWRKLFSRRPQPAPASPHIPASAANSASPPRTMSRSTPASTLFPTSLPPLNKRRGHRVSAFMPVFVYGRSQDEPFAEQTITLNVSAQGGFLALSADVARSQKLLMANLQTNEELHCRIARVVKTQGGITLVGFEFLRPSPNFWSIDFTS
jgi:hypothetical protein